MTPQNELLLSTYFIFPAIALETLRFPVFQRRSARNITYFQRILTILS